MKITSGRREDILKEKAAYEADYADRKSRYSEQHQNLYKATREVLDAAEQYVAGQLKDCNVDLNISADGNSYGEGGLSIRVQSNEDNVHGHKGPKALSWDWKVELLSTGEIKKETSSWSGLTATTEEQLESLRQSVKALEILNRIDWPTVLNKELPKYEEYMTEKNPDWGQKPHFDQQLFEADLEECIGKDILIAGNNSRSRGAARVTNWYMILRETPKQYVIVDIPAYALEDQYLSESGTTREAVIEKNKKYGQNISKVKFTEMVKRPLQTQEV